MREFKHGELDQAAGGEVRCPKQAIAIALSEAGASSQQSPTENRKRLRQTTAGERRSAATRSELYEKAKRAGVPGRSCMSKSELERALKERSVEWTRTSTTR